MKTVCFFQGETIRQNALFLPSFSCKYVCSLIRGAPYFA